MDGIVSWKKNGKNPIWPLSNFLSNHPAITFVFSSSTREGHMTRTAAHAAAPAGMLLKVHRRVALPISRLPALARAASHFQR